MRKGFFKVVGTLVLSIAPIGFVMAADAGNVANVGGIVELQRGKDIKPVGPATVLQPGDTLKTGPGGKIRWEMADDSTFLMMENSSVRLDEFNYNSDSPAAGKSVFSLLKGAVRGVSGLIAKANPANFKLETPVATMGVRGTDFIAVYCNKDCSSNDGKFILSGSRKGGRLIKIAANASKKFADGIYVLPISGAIQACNKGGCESLGGKGARPVKTAAGGAGGGCVFAPDTATKPKVVSNCPIPNALFEEEDRDDPSVDKRGNLNLRSTPIDPEEPPVSP